MEKSSLSTITSPEEQWETLCYEAQRAYLGGNTDQAIRHWEDSFKVLKDIPEGDPRNIANQNNAGVVYFLTNTFDQCVRALSQTIPGWQNARNWTQSMTVDGTAKSSLFHQRLESRHQDSFNDLSRERYRQWIDGAESITAFNLAVVQIRQNKKAEGIRQLSNALKLREQTFGPANPELSLMRKVMAQYAEEADTTAGNENTGKTEGRRTRSALERWETDRPHEMNDTRRLLSALCFTTMLCESD